MADIDLRKRDALDDFEARQITLLGKTKCVYVQGSGPAVIVISEMPGISPYVARFARWVRDAGFTVFMPSLFGTDGVLPGTGRTMLTLARACISAEFRAFSANASSPVTQWLRALAADIEINDPTCGVISNKDGAVIRDGREVLDRIVAQISNPVRWDLCMTTLSENVSGALEVPPAGTLVGLLKRAVPIVETFAIKSVADLSLAGEFVVRHNQEVSN